MRLTASFPCILALTAFAPSWVLAAGQDECRASAPREDRLEAVGPRGELVLASRGTAVLSGLRWPDEGAVAHEANAWLLDRRGRPLTVTTRGGEVDRWGRSRIDATTVDGDLAGGLISAGLALADAGEGDAFCRPDLLALEEAPRKAGLGVWAVPVRDARDGAGIAAIEGDFILAQGRVLNVGERSRRTYLNFSAKGEPGLSVTVPKRTWRIMQERGLTATTLKGRLVRVRGRVEVWRGPMIDIASADMIEMLEGGQALRR